MYHLGRKLYLDQVTVICIVMQVSNAITERPNHIGRYVIGVCYFN